MQKKIFELVKKRSYKWVSSRTFVGKKNIDNWKITNLNSYEENVRAKKRREKNSKRCMVKLRIGRERGENNMI